MEPLTTGQIRKIVESGNRERIAQIDPEELAIFYENEQQRTLFSPEGIMNLYNGICLEAVNEYRKAHKTAVFGFNDHKKTSMEKECEEFFGTDFFRNITGCRNKKQVIKAIEETMIEERKKKLQAGMLKA